MFFVRNITILFIVLSSLVAIAMLYTAGRLTHEALFRSAGEKDAAIVEMIGRLAFAPAHVEDLEQGIVPPAVQSAIATAGTSDDLRFIRLIDRRAQTILASNRPAEAGLAYGGKPAFSDGVVETRRGVFNKEEIIEMTYAGPVQFGLWAGVGRDVFKDRAIVLITQQAMLILSFFAIVAVLLYVLQMRYIMKPVQRLYESLAPSGSKKGPVPNEIGELLDSFNDVTERIRATLERDKLVSQMKSDFITTTAHQLRTPLSGINWALDSLLASKKEPLADSQRTVIARAHEKNKELISMVGTLLNAASIEEGEFGYHPEEGSLEEMIASVVEDEQHMAHEGGVTLTYGSAGQTFPRVYFDTDRLRWTLRNIIENAVRYTPKGGSVTVWIERDGDYLKIGVKDTGIGIPASQREHIFEKFFRSKNAVEKRNDGSGLGLYIAKNVITYHGGSIWFESEEGKGTTFYFTIPLRSRFVSKEKQHTFKSGL